MKWDRETGTDREPEDKGREGGGWGVGSGERGRKGPRRSRRETGRDPRPEGRTRNPKERLPSRRCSLQGKETGGQSWPRRGAGEASNRQEPHLQHPGNKPRGSALPEAQRVPSAAPNPRPQSARPVTPAGFCGMRKPGRDLRFWQGTISLVTASASGPSQDAPKVSALERPAPWQGLGPTHLQGSGVCSAPRETAWEPPTPVCTPHLALELWAGEPAGKTARIRAAEAPGE